MSGLTPQAMEVLREHHGCATASMLRAAGVGRDACARMVERGLLICRFERVLRIASAPETLESRCAELCLAYPRAFITGPTGGKFMGLRRMGSADPIHLAVHHGANIGPLDGVHLRQTTNVAAIDVQARRRDGIRLASAPRLAFDLGADLRQPDHASVVEQILHEKRCTFTTMLGVARRLIHPNRPGSIVVATTLMERGHRIPAESHPEFDLGSALRAVGVPVEPQGAWLDLPNGDRARIDLAVPALRWGIEVDVHPDHLLLRGTTKDKRRDRQCRLLGWQVDRVTKLDLLDPDGLVGELQSLYLMRSIELRAA